MKQNSSNKSEVFAGYQWGEPIGRERFFSVDRVAEQLEITAAMPRYSSPDNPCDLISQYETALKKSSIGKQRAGKDSPHIRFANAGNDEELINFVRDFGPVVCTDWRIRELKETDDSHGRDGRKAILIMVATQDIQELRNEQLIYKAALGLTTELAKKTHEYDVDEARKRIGEISDRILRWPEQWARERRKRKQNPRWRVRSLSTQRIAGLAKLNPADGLTPQVDARIVLCELINVFPGLAFPNPLELHAHIRFGIRPLLYSLLRREFLYPRGSAVCANDQCRNFFEIERSGQRFCDDLCSRKQRQRHYWQMRGKKARKARRKRRTKAT